MIYEYKCQKCGEITEINESINADHPKTVTCKCGATSSRYWGSNKVHVPENFKAMSDVYNGDNGANFDYISNRMKHGTRISGKEKVYY